MSSLVVVTLDLNVRASADHGGGLRRMVSSNLVEDGAEFVSERRAFSQLYLQYVCQNPLRAVIVWISNEGVGGLGNIRVEVALHPIAQLFTSPSGNGSGKGHGQSSVFDHRFLLVGHSMDSSSRRCNVSRIGAHRAGLDSSSPT